MYGKNLKSKTAKGSGKKMSKIVADTPLNKLGSNTKKTSPPPQYQSKTPIAKRGGGKRISKGGSF